MRAPLPAGAWRRLAAAAAVAVGVSPFFLLPMFNSDVYWHLSAGRFIASHGAVPRADFLSSTMAGAPWIDFEWLSQLVLYALNSAFACAGLIAWRAGLGGGAAFVLLSLVRRDGGGAGACGLAAMLFGAVLFPLLGVRPDDASLLLFALLLYGLESVRLRRRQPGAGLVVAASVMFALWANLHLGFLYGLLLIGLYGLGAAAEALPARAGEEGRAGALADVRFYAVLLAAAAVSTLANPYGLKVYAVASGHWRDLRAISEILSEWKPPALDNPASWPYWALLALCAAALLLQYRRERKVSFAVLFSAAFFGFASVRHVRHAGYFALIAIPALLRAVGDSGLRPRELRLLRAGGGALGALLVLHWWLAIRPLFPVVSGSRWCSVLGRRVAGFLETESPTLAGRTLYNSWGEGGYLGYRLFPAYRVFFDGRYLFHPLLRESVAANRSAEGWQRFLDAHGIAIACLERAQAPPTEEPSPFPKADGGFVARPFYVSYMPSKTWALVFWGDRDLIFARRSAFASSWVDRHEYRLLRPDDYPRLSALAAAGRLDLSRTIREARRHRGEDAGAGAEDAVIVDWIGRLRALDGGAPPADR